MVRNKKQLFLGAFTVVTMLLAACGAGSSSNNTTGSSDSTGAGSASSTSVAQGTGETSSAGSVVSATDTTEAGTAITDTSVMSGTETPSSSDLSGTSEVTSTEEAISATSEVTSMAEGVSTTTVSTPEAVTSTVNGTMIANLFTAFAQVLTNNAAVTDTGATTANAEQYTVFVPSGQAFDQSAAILLVGMNASAGTSANSGLVDQSPLAQVLAYHVVRGRYTAADLANVTELTTLSGLTLTVKSEGGVIYINNARVVQPDVESANATSSAVVGNRGTIHLIDSVLLPPSLNGLTNGGTSSSSTTETITSTDMITTGTDTVTATETVTP